MKRISDSSKSFYPGVLKEYFIDSIIKSRFKDKVVYDDLDNLTICIKGFCITMFNVNMFFKEIFRHYKLINFKVQEISILYHDNSYQEYLVKVGTTYKNVKWVLPIRIIGGFLYFPMGKQRKVYLSKFKNKVLINEITNVEKLTFAFYKIINNILVNNELLLKYYILFNKRISRKLMIETTMDFYQVKEESINMEKIKNRIKILKSDKRLRKSWHIYKEKNDVKTGYDDIRCAIELLWVSLRKVV